MCHGVSQHSTPAAAVASSSNLFVVHKVADLPVALGSAAEQPGNAKVLHQRMEDVGYEADGVLLRQLHWQIKSSQPADRREAVAV